MTKPFHWPAVCFCLSFILLGYSCQAPNEAVETGPQVIDIEEFLSMQYERLASKGEITKKAIVNDSVEIHQVNLTEQQWKEELKFFTNSNINRKSWVDYFQIDTQQLADQHYRIVYTTEREKVPVKKATAVKNGHDSIVYLSLQIKRSNPISALDRELIYAFPDSIVIINKESLWLLEDQRVKLIYEWSDGLQ